ncbi:putative quinol monooxygenase [Prauserella aidingensis]|uniref:putative quinol monooxygenase n=1 Tax=Prauserella aidingensis TaxID=387890 RepID=UPI0020A24F09|nr:putative quinol monooxygenase [Prauserella aidingensis]
MILVTILSTAPAGRGEELAAAWLHAAEQTLARDPGCKSFSVARSHDDQDQVVASEIYESKAALDAHNSSDLSKELMPGLVPLIAGQPQVYVGDLLTADGPSSSR